MKKSAGVYILSLINRRTIHANHSPRYKRKTQGLADFFMRTDPVSFSTVGVSWPMGYELMPLKGA